MSCERPPPVGSRAGVPTLSHTEIPDRHMDKHKQTSASDKVEIGAESSKSSSGFPWMFLAGTALVGSGVGLTVLPMLARDLSWITNSFAKHGITGAPIAMTGVVLCGMWIATRKRHEQPAAAPTGADHDLLLEQLASDLAQARGGIQDLRVEFVYLKDQVQSAATQRELQEAQSGANDAQSAMFGLAASMDQLAARLEQRIKTQDAVLQEAIQNLRNDVTATGVCVAELRTRIEEGMQSSNQTHDGYSEYRSGGERQIEIEGGYRADDNDLEVYVELDESEERGLGLLDEFDDHGQHNTLKQSPSIRPSTNRAQLALDVERVTAPIPSRHDASEASIDEKLAALRSLMSDPTVRHALEAARRGA